jgi:hypothetical protein
MSEYCDKADAWDAVSAKNAEIQRLRAALEAAAAECDRIAEDMPRAADAYRYDWPGGKAAGARACAAAIREMLNPASPTE